MTPEVDAVAEGHLAALAERAPEAHAALQSAPAGRQATARRVLCGSDFVAAVLVSRPGLLGELLGDGDLDRALALADYVARVARVASDAVRRDDLRTQVRDMRERMRRGQLSMAGP